MRHVLRWGSIARGGLALLTTALLLGMIFFLMAGSGQASQVQRGQEQPAEVNRVSQQGSLPACRLIERIPEEGSPCGEFAYLYVKAYRDPLRRQVVGTGIIEPSPDTEVHNNSREGLCVGCQQDNTVIVRGIRLEGTDRVVPIRPCQIIIPRDTLTNRVKYQLAILLPARVAPAGCETARVQVGSGGVQVNYIPFGGVNLSVHVPWPRVLYDVEPYPVGLVGYPTRVTMVEMPVARRSAYHFYLGAGGGNPNAPEGGDIRNIWYEVRLVPLSNQGGVVFPPGAAGEAKTIRPGETVTFTWDLPSHPASGAEPAPAMAGRLGLATDFPAFSGDNMSQAAYALACSLSWEEYTYVQRGGRWVGVWTRHRQGGIIPLNKVENARDNRYLADTDGDGHPDVLLNRQVALRRRDARGRVVDTVALGERTYWWVREAQGQISR